LENEERGRGSGRKERDVGHQDTVHNKQEERYRKQVLLVIGDLLVVISLLCRRTQLRMEGMKMPSSVSFIFEPPTDRDR